MEEGGGRKDNTRKIRKNRGRKEGRIVGRERWEIREIKERETKGK